MSASDVKVICLNCKYFIGDNAVLGSCKRYPQAINKHTNDWCGEYESAPIVIKVELPIELQEAAEGLMNLSVEPKKRGRKPKNATSFA